MISKLVGSILKKNTKTKMSWPKLGAALVVSNIFFFLLFSGDRPEASPPKELPPGWVEAQVRVELLTPFEEGRKVLLLHREGRRILEGKLKSNLDQEGRLTVLVQEKEAEGLFLYQGWEVLPYMAHLKFPRITRSHSHEIKY